MGEYKIVKLEIFSGETDLLADLFCAKKKKRYAWHVKGSNDYCMFY